MLDVPVSTPRPRINAGVLRRSIVSRAIELLARIRGARGHVVVHGWPASEGNVVEVVRSLIERYRGRIYWLVDDPENWVITVPDNVTIVKKASFRAAVAHATSETVFFTHGLFGDVRPSASQVFVNLWHGYGPKRNRDAEQSRRPIFPSTYVVAGTELYARREATDFRVPPSRVILSGNPRVAQFHDAPGEEFAERMGLDGRPYVVWMPTYRSRRQVGVADSGVTDVTGEVTDVIAVAEPWFRALTERGITVLLRRHPLDAVSAPVPWAAELSDDVLGETRTTLYSALGGAAGLVTDYSSVWTDYLVLDRPIAFYAPDRDEFKGGRGLDPADVLEWLPGVDLLEPGASEGFAQEILTGVGKGAGLRSVARDRLGLVRDFRAADTLLMELDARGAFTRSGGLGPPRERVDGVGAFRKGSV